MANNLGVSAYFDGRLERDAPATMPRPKTAFRAIGDVTDAALAATNTGEVLVNQSRLDEAEPLLRDAARVLRASGHVRGRCFAEMHLGRLYIAGATSLAPRSSSSGASRRTSNSEPASVYRVVDPPRRVLVRSGRADEALGCWSGQVENTSEDVSILEASQALVEAHAYATVGDARASIDPSGRRHRRRTSSEARVRPGATC